MCVCALVELGLSSRDSDNTAGWKIWPSNHVRDKIFLSPECPGQFWCPPILLNGYQSSFLGVMWPGHEVDCLSPSSAKPTSEWS